MKTLGKFSQKKYLDLSHPARIKALSKLVDLLESNTTDPDSASVINQEITNCVAWMEDTAPISAIELVQEMSTATTDKDIPIAIARYKSKQGQNFTDYQLNIIKGDGVRQSDPETLARAQNIIVILDNLRSAFNVGSVFRTAECLALKSLCLCGITPTPANPALRKTAMGTHERVEWRSFPDTLTAIETARNEGYHICALETTSTATSVFSTDFTLPLALVIGNESLGIAPEVIKLCHSQVYLPVQGWKNSLNVANAFSICAYQVVFTEGANLAR